MATPPERSAMKGKETRLFVFLVVCLFPILSVALVGGYGFIIWFMQMLLGHLAHPPDPSSPTEPRNMAASMHISSLLVHVRPEWLAAVKANLRQLEGLELHQESPQGKLVVVLETEHERHILARLEQINALPGVLNAALVYHELLDTEGGSE